MVSSAPNWHLPRFAKLREMCEHLPIMRTDAARTAPTMMTTFVAESLRDATHWASIREPHRITTLHLLVGMIHATGSIAETVLSAYEISDANVWAAIDYWDLPKSGAIRSPRLLKLRRSPRWKSSALAVGAHAARESSERGGHVVDTGDLLLALSHERGSRAARILDRAQLDRDTLRQEIKNARGDIDEGRGTAELPDFDKARPTSARDIS